MTKREQILRIFDSGTTDPHAISVKVQSTLQSVKTILSLAGRTQVSTRKWTSAELKELARMANMNLRYKEIAARLGRTENACKVKFNRVFKVTKRSISVSGRSGS